MTSRYDYSVMPCNLKVISANRSHVDAVVQIHLDAFKGFFLESLGRRFLRELYRGFIVEPSGICLVAISIDGIVTGFVAGTIQPEGFFRRLLQRRGFAFLWAGAASFLRHPIRVGRKFVFAIHYRGEKPTNVSSAALLSSIGVAPEAKGKGIGRALLASFCEETRKAGVLNIFLTTDRDNNELVNTFYRVNGFQLNSSFLKERDRWMNLYSRSCAEIDQDIKEISTNIIYSLGSSSKC
ncbi:GNAT family N-acetyltransferase [Alloacidobacterium dinghuense]|uniref:GNAT family N-acetyltransferase n=1 Tax=Alloacidobacterium dinghuense TaxID=2763107 RepID=A0A7G8BE10_9BACT|nr:GNAT family N-acetyltransferase [Alloacidobacterium dinghuense]QNI30780.1 GNAT family N-acetyltransferase [Alloacidobacterium dinghuense]